MTRTVYRAVDLQPIVAARPDVDAQIEDARASPGELIALVEQMDADASALYAAQIEMLAGA